MLVGAFLVIVRLLSRGGAPRMVWRHPTTLILAAANRDYAVLVSDRRVTVDGRLVAPRDDERNKAGVLLTRDARVAFAFTGLARFRTFDTERWLLETLPKCAPPDFVMGPLLERFARRAEDAIGALPADPRARRLTVVFLGYCYRPDELPRGYLWRISNFEGGPGDEPSDAALPAFTTAYWRDKQNPAERWSLLIPAGWTPALGKRDMEFLHGLVHEGRPPRAIVDKAVDVLREAARSASSKEMVGETCTSITLPSSPAAEAEFAYHAGSVTEVLGGIAYIDARGGPSGTWSLKMESVRLNDTAGVPHLVVPKVGRNDPCPCKSGRKYKRCHGASRAASGA